MAHPDCPRNTPKECRIQHTGGYSTLVGWTPEYDRKGNRLNEDPNTHSDGYRCSTCGMAWVTRRRSGKTETEITEPARTPEESNE